jgi:hypothetical protein
MALQDILAHFGFTFDKAKLQEVQGSLGSVTNTVQDVIGTVKGAVTAFAGKEIIQAIHGWVGDVTKELDDLGDTAEQIGVNAGFLASWGYAAQLSAADAEALTGGLRKLSLALYKGGEGAAETNAAFKTLGLSIKDGQGNLQTIENILPEVAEAFSKLPAGPKAAGLAVQLFGKQGAALVPLLRKGKAGVAELTAEFRELNGELSEEALQSAGEYQDALYKMNVVTSSLKRELVIFLVPALVKLSGGVQKGLVRFREWNKETNLFSHALKALGVVGIASVVKGLASVAPQIIKLVAALAPFVLQWLAIYLLVDDFISFLQGKDSVIGDFLNTLFGEGSAAKVRDFFAEVGDSVEWFFGLFGDKTQQAADDLKMLEDGIRSGDLTDALYQWLVTPLDGSAKASHGILLQLLNWIGEIVAGAIVSLLQLPVTLGKAMGETIYWIETKIQGLLAWIGKIGEAFTQVKNLISFGEGEGFTVDTKPQGPKKDGGELARESFGGTGRREPQGFYGTAPKAGNTTNQNVTVAPVINVTVPPGTPATQAKDVAKLVQNSFGPVNRQALFSLEPTK